MRESPARCGRLGRSVPMVQFSMTFIDHYGTSLNGCQLNDVIVASVYKCANFGAY